MTELRERVGSLEHQLTQTRQEAAEKASQSDYLEREHSAQLEAVQRQLSSAQSEMKQERTEANEQIKKMTASSSQIQLVIQTKDKVT